MMTIKPTVQDGKKYLMLDGQQLVGKISPIHLPSVTIIAIPLNEPHNELINEMYKLTSQYLKYIILPIKWNASQCAKNKQPGVDQYQSACSFTFKSSMLDLQDATKEQVLEFINSFDTVLTDCDGVLWQHDKALPGSADALNHFRKLGKRIFYVTNNSTKIRIEYARKAESLGFTATEEEIICTSYLVAHYLKSLAFAKKVYILGSECIGEELNAVGIRHIGTGPDPLRPDYMSMKMTDLDPEVGAVVVSFDEHVNYLKLIKAASYLASEKCLFLGSNTDETYPVPGSIVMPAAGTFVRGIEFCTKRKAFVVGKPYEYMQKYLANFGLNPARTLMIGDNCSTDIELGVRCGFQTLLVLSGVTTEEDMKMRRKNKTEPIPDVVLPKLGDLMSLIHS